MFSKKSPMDRKSTWILVVIGLFIIGGAIWYYASTLKIERENPQGRVVDRAQETNLQGPNLDEFISYSIPQGWKKEIEQNGSISISSPDYKEADGMGGVEKGAYITISRSFKGPEYLLQTKLNEISTPPSPFVDIERIDFNGLEALSWSTSLEIYTFNILFVQKPYLWGIYVGTSTIKKESEYREEIDSFLSSVRLK